MYTTLRHDGHFRRCGIVFATHDGSSVTHSTSFRSSLTSDKSDNGFAITIRLDPASGFGFIGAADLADLGPRPEGEPR